MGATFLPKFYREDKGKSLVSIDVCDYTVIDIETTGLDTYFDEIIELGAVKVQNNAEVDRFQSFVHPQNPISEFIENLTGISNDLVADAPDIKQVLPDFLSFVGCSIIIGHNVNFDINFIYDEALNCQQPGFSNDFIDTMRLSRRLYKTLPNHKLATLCSHLNIPQPTEHRAIADCIRTHLCYQAMRQYCIDTNTSLVAPWEHSYVRAKSIAAQTDLFNEDGPVYQKVFAFTGTLEKMTRQEAMQAVVNRGGLIGDGVTRKTNYLVLGNNDYCKAIKDGKSNKQKKAEELQLRGYDIATITEDVFCDMLHDSDLPTEAEN